jgi:hypothetical protein
MGRPFYAVIIPLGEGGHPDQGLPGGGYYPDQGLPGGGNYPDQGLPGGGLRPGHPIAPGGRPVDPGFGWGGGERPGHPIAPGGGRPVDPGFGYPSERPDQGLPPELGVGDIGPAHPWVPPEGETLPPPPEDIADQIVIAVWKPDEQAWKVAVADGPSGPHPGQPLPPQRPQRR